MSAGGCYKTSLCAFLWKFDTILAFFKKLEISNEKRVEANNDEHESPAKSAARTPEGVCPRYLSLMGVVFRDLADALQKHLTEEVVSLFEDGCVRMGLGRS
uniref:MIF4G domain-containing protein n=1 Tax=Steinernema glaseri TaxID=37863 RepID=A0A1I7YW06_9BILA